MGNEESRTLGIGRTVRLIADMIKGASHTRRSAADLLGIGGPAAARQLEAVEAHLPIVRTRDTPRGKAYSIARGPEEQPTIDLGTAISACFGSSLATLFGQTRYAPDLRRATKSVIERAAGSADFQNIDRKFFFHARGGEVALRADSDAFDDLLTAVLTCKRVRLHYTRFSGKEEPVDVRPLSVLVYEHQLYILGLDETDRSHTYRLSRIRRVEVSSMSFDYPSRGEFDPTQLFRDSFGVFVGSDFAVEDICVRLSTRWRTYVETHCWHPSQRNEASDDGVVVKLHVRMCPEVERWILGFGEDAEVVGPASLRKKIAERATALAARYR